MLAVEPRWFERGVREAIHIRMEQPSLNNDVGRYNLPSIWNNVLRSRAGRLALRTNNQSGSWLASSQSHLELRQSEQVLSGRRKLSSKLVFVIFIQS